MGNTQNCKVWFVLSVGDRCACVECWGRCFNNKISSVTLITSAPSPVNFSTDRNKVTGKSQK